MENKVNETKVTKKATTKEKVTEKKPATKATAKKATAKKAPAKKTTKKHSCRSLNTYSVIKEVKVVQIKCKNLFLRIATFQFYRNNPLNRFLQKTLKRALCFCRIQLFRQLLSNRTSASGTRLLKNATLHDSAQQGFYVNT